jgi:hypothetical protein
LQALIVGAILVSVVPGSAESPRDTARTLNSKGYQAYKQRRYAKALEHYRAAVEADESYAAAHYNLACTLGVWRKLKRDVCDENAYRMDIVEHLQTAVRLDRSWLARAKRDPDLTPIHDTMGYQLLMGLDPTRTEDVTRILQRVTWYGPQTGVCRSPAGLVFRPRGKVSYWEHIEGCEEVARPRRAWFAGTYTVDGNRVTVRLSRPVKGRREFQGVLKPVEHGRASFVIPGLGVHEGEIDGFFSDDPSECSA